MEQDRLNYDELPLNKPEITPPPYFLGSSEHWDGFPVNTGFNNNQVVEIGNMVLKGVDEDFEQDTLVD